MFHFLYSNSLHQDCGVFGGWPYLAYEYIMNAVSSIVSILLASNVAGEMATVMHGTCTLGELCTTACVGELIMIIILL